MYIFEDFLFNKIVRYLWGGKKRSFLYLIGEDFCFNRYS